MGIQFPIKGAQHLLPHFSAHGQTTGWIKMPVGTEVGLGPGPCYMGTYLPPKWAHKPPMFGPSLLWPNGRPSQLPLNTCTNGCPKTAEQIEMVFGLWTRVESTSSVIFTRWRQCDHMRGHIGATWRMRLNRPSAAAMRSYVKLLWPVTTCFATCWLEAAIGRPLLTY